MNDGNGQPQSPQSSDMYQLCLQWGIAGPAVLEVCSDVLMLVDGTTLSIIVGNANLTRFEKKLGAGNGALGRQIISNHVVTQLMVMGPLVVCSYETVIIGVDGTPQHVRGNVSARERSKIVWCLQGVPAPVSATRSKQEEEIAGMKWVQEHHMRNAVQMIEEQPTVHLKMPTRTNDVPPKTTALAELRCETTSQQVLPSLDPSGWKLKALSEVKWQEARKQPTTLDMQTAMKFNGLSMLQEEATKALQMNFATPQDRGTTPTGSSVGTSKAGNGLFLLAQSSIDLRDETGEINKKPECQPLDSESKTEQISKGKFLKSRRPYRFCSMCWLKKHEWVLRSVTLPDGRSRSLNGHSNDSCPLWAKGTVITPDQSRSYATAFKAAQRKHKLYQIALSEFKLLCSHMSSDQVEKFLLN